MSRHTMAPWTVEGDSIVCASIKVRYGSSKNQPVAKRIAQYVNPEDRDLITASPDLLEACEFLLACEEQEDLAGYVAPETKAAALARVRLAVKKARGRR